jgi:hypothetical protein
MAVLFQPQPPADETTKLRLSQSKAMAGVMLCWERMGSPRSGAAFINRALQRVEGLRGDKAKAKQEKQLTKAIEKAKQVKMPRPIKTPLGDYMPRQRNK